jgi:hypothetical protein
MKLFQVIEYSSFFAVRHLPSGAECPMGDGVDAIDYVDEDGEGRCLWPGTPDFVQEWTDALNANPEETLEAYFPELVGQPEEEAQWDEWAQDAQHDPKVKDMLQQRPREEPA